MKLFWILIFFSVGLSAENKYLMFPGVMNSYVFNRELSIDDKTKELTIELRLRYEEASKKSGLLMLGRDPSDSSFSISLSPEGAVEVLIQKGHNEQIVIRSGETLSPKEWHNVAVAYNGNAIDADSSVQNALALKFFFDGKLVKSNLLSKAELVPLSLSAMNGVRLGFSAAGKKSLLGGIAEVRIWSKALNRELISEWQNKTIDDTHPLHENLVCNYEMAENSEGKIADETGTFPLSYFGSITAKNIVDKTTSGKFIETLSEDDPDYLIFKVQEKNLYTLSQSDRDPFHEVVKERDPSELLPQEINAVKKYLAGYELRAVVKGRKSICFFNKGKLKVGDFLDFKIGNRVINLKVDRIKEKPLGVVFKAGSLEIVKEIKR